VLSAKFDTLVEKRDLAELRQELLREIASLRQENAALRKDMEASDAALRQEMENGFAAVRKEMQLLEQRLIIKLGAMLVVATGVLATLMKLL
jgi:D-alanyl-D-alanine dipeptidase